MHPFGRQDEDKQASVAPRALLPVWTSLHQEAVAEAAFGVVAKGAVLRTQGSVPVCSIDLDRAFATVGVGSIATISELSAATCSGAVYTYAVPLTGIEPAALVQVAGPSGVFHQHRHIGTLAEHWGGAILSAGRALLSRVLPLAEETEVQAPTPSINELRERDRQWFYSEPSRVEHYAGKYVAIADGSVRAATTSISETVAAARRLGIAAPLILHVSEEDEKTVPFGM